MLGEDGRFWAHHPRKKKFLEQDPLFQTGVLQVLTSKRGQPRLWRVWWGVSSLESKGLWASTWRRQWIILSAQPWLVMKARSSRQRSWLSKCSGCCRQDLQWPGVRAWHQPVPISKVCRPRVIHWDGGRGGTTFGELTGCMSSQGPVH